VDDGKKVGQERTALKIYSYIVKTVVESSPPD